MGYSTWARYLSREPLPGMQVRAPRRTPRLGDVLFGYEVIEDATGIRTLSTGGVVASAVLAVVCWPLAFVPCCLGVCHEPHQRPVYGPPEHRPPPEAYAVFTDVGTYYPNKYIPPQRADSPPPPPPPPPPPGNKPGYEPAPGYPAVL